MPILVRHWTKTEACNVSCSIQAQPQMYLCTNTVWCRVVSAGNRLADIICWCGTAFDSVLGKTSGDQQSIHVSHAKLRSSCISAVCSEDSCLFCFVVKLPQLNGAVSLAVQRLSLVHGLVRFLYHLTGIGRGRLLSLYSSTLMYWLLIVCCLFMQPSLGGCDKCCTLSVCPSVCPSVSCLWFTWNRIAVLHTSNMVEMWPGHE